MSNFILGVFNVLSRNVQGYTSHQLGRRLIECRRWCWTVAVYREINASVSLT